MPQTALSTTNFLGRLGINTHISYTDGQYDDVAAVVQALDYLGIHQVRDATPVPQIDAVWRGHYDAAVAAGLSFSFGVDRNFAPAEMVQILHDFATAHPGVRFTIEGPNEVNNWPVSFAGLSGDEAAVAYQAALYAAVKADPLLHDVTVYSATGMLEASASDVANYHHFPWNGEQPYAQLLREQATQTGMMAGEPVVLTEAGYYTLPNDTSAWGGVDEATQAKLLLNLALDTVRLGIDKVYFYQLFDAYPDPAQQDPEDHFGLFRLDGSPKPAAIALHNLTTVLADDSSAMTSTGSSTLDYHLDGMPPTASSLLLQKSSGSFDLVLWNEADVWDQETHHALNVAPQTVSIDLGATFRTVSLFDPVNSSEASATWHDVREITVTLSDVPQIVQMTGLAIVASEPTDGIPPPVQASPPLGDVALPIVGSASNDSLPGKEGGHHIVGGEGYDVVVYASQARSSGSFSHAADGSFVFTHSGAIDTFSGVEEIRFLDGSQVIATSAETAEIARLYKAAFQRVPDPAGLRGWVDYLASGHSLREVATFFASSPEYRSLYGEPDDPGFVTQLYRNVLDRAPDEGGLSFWQAALRKDQARADVLLAFSESAENVGRTSSLQSDGYWSVDPTAAQLARLYDTMFHRAPDLAGLSFWKAAIEGGQISLVGVAASMVGSPEFEALYGRHAGDAELVALLYRNSLDREGSAAEIDYYVDRISNQSLDRINTILAFSESAEHQQLTYNSVMDSHGLILNS